MIEALELIPKMLENAESTNALLYVILVIDAVIVVQLYFEFRNKNNPANEQATTGETEPELDYKPIDIPNNQEQ